MPLLETNDKRTEMAAHVHRAHTGELCKISWSQRSLLWDIQSLRGQAAAVSFTTGGAKNTAVLKKLCIENGISFVKLGEFHPIKSDVI